MKVGPTVRICVLLDEALVAGGVFCEAGGVACSGAAVATEPFLAGVDFTCCGRAIFLELSSVTMISPCCSAVALSSRFLSASAQVWPAALHEQVGLNS